MSGHSRQESHAGETREERRERRRRERRAQGEGASVLGTPIVSPQPIRPESIRSFLDQRNIPSAASSVSGASVAGSSTGNAPETGKFTGGAIYEEPSPTDPAYHEMPIPSRSASRAPGSSRQHSSGRQSSRQSSRQGSSHHSRSASNASMLNSPAPGPAWVPPPPAWVPPPPEQTTYDTQDMESMHAATSSQQSTPMPTPARQGFVPQQTYGQQPPMPPPMPPMEPPMGQPMGPPMGPPMPPPMPQPSMMPSYSRSLPGQISTAPWQHNYQAMITGGTQPQTRPAQPLTHASRALSASTFYQPGQSHHPGPTLPALPLQRPSRDLSNVQFYVQGVGLETVVRASPSQDPRVQGRRPSGDRQY